MRKTSHSAHPIFSEPDFQSLLGETRYLLEHWHLSMSSTGLLWIEPNAASVTPEQLAGLLSLLSRDGESSLPAMIKIDLSHARLAGEQWTVAESMLCDFAARIACSMRFVRGAAQPVTAIIFTRSPELTGNGACSTEQ